MHLKFFCFLTIFFLSATSHAETPVGLLLKALGPIPLSYSKLDSQAYEAYQGHEVLVEKGRPAKARVVQNFVYDPLKFDDLTSRYQLNTSSFELNKALLLRGLYESTLTAAAMDKVMKEYFRRIYQGYSTAMAVESVQKRKFANESLLDVGKNVVVNYQSLYFSNELEGRVGYDVVANSSHFKLVSRFVEGEVAFASMDQKSPGAIPENIQNVDEAMEQYGHFDRTSVSLSRSVRAIGLRMKARYGVASHSLDYGFSKSLPGPLAIQVVREESNQKDLSGFLVVQLTLAKHF
jgi:hypothetical protein